MSNRILVGDAGGTSTSWRFIDGNKIEQYNSGGFNYTTHSLLNFRKEIEALHIKPVRTYLYIAGADTPDQRKIIEQELEEVLGKVKVENDLLGAARSVLGSEEGYICILGTGSNASYYDGTEVQKVSASLGYLLGDEGSGAYMGKQLLKGMFRNQFDLDIINAFKDYHQLSIADTIKHIYDQEKPNIYLASFSRFIGEHKDHPQIYQLIYESFKTFFSEFFGERKIDLPIHFVGSIAHHYSGILRQVGADLNFTISSIVDSPIAGLALYHKTNG